MRYLIGSFICCFVLGLYWKLPFFEVWIMTITQATFWMLYDKEN